MTEMRQKRKEVSCGLVLTSFAQIGAAALRGRHRRILEVCIREEGRDQHLTVPVRGEEENHQDGVEEIFNYPTPYFIPFLEKKKDKKFL